MQDRYEERKEFLKKTIQDT